MKTFRIFFTILCIFICIGNLHAQKFSYNGWSASIGLFLPEEWDIGGNAYARVFLGPVVKNLYLLPGFSFGGGMRELEHTDDVAGFENREFSLNIAYFTTDNLRNFYLGTGISMNLITWEYYYYSGYDSYWVDYEEDEVGFTPFAGYIYEVNDRLSLFSEFKYHYIPDGFSTYNLMIGLYFP